MTNAQTYSWNGLNFVVTDIWPNGARWGQCIGKQGKPLAQVYRLTDSGPVAVNTPVGALRMKPSGVTVWS